MNRILLTGGNGFIGRNIREQLGMEYQIFAPSSFELNLLDKTALTKFLKNYRITDVIHCAVYNRTRRELNPEADLGANLKMFYHLVEHSSELNKIIYFGSGAEYDKRYPICMAKEENIGKTIPLMNDYSLSKYLMNEEARRSKNIYNLRLFGVFGKYEDWRHCFISNLCCKAIFNFPLTVRQECIFDFISVNDIIPVLRWIIKNSCKHHDYNLCSGQSLRLTQIAEKVRLISRKDLEIQVLSEGFGNEYTGCKERICSEYQNSCTNMEQQIELLYQYYYHIKEKIDYSEIKSEK